MWGERAASVNEGGRLYSGFIHVGGVRGGSHSATAGREAPRVRAAKCYKFGEEKS